MDKTESELDKDRMELEAAIRQSLSPNDKKMIRTEEIEPLVKARADHIIRQRQQTVQFPDDERVLYVPMDKPRDKVVLKTRGGWFELELDHHDKLTLSSCSCSWLEIRPLHQGQIQITSFHRHTQPE